MKTSIEELPDHLKCYYNVKILSDGRFVGIYHLLYTHAIIRGQINDIFGYDDRWCYEPGKANAALEAWDGEGEPEGWHRHPTSGRRRPDGDTSKEYIHF